MPLKEKIILLSNHQINKNKWDSTVIESSNSLIYGHSFYLDAMSAGWMALTTENYSWVLPLTHRKKFGIQYLYQPAFMQQVGVFAKDTSTIPWQEICIFLQKHFSFCEMFWNYKTETTLLAKQVLSRQQTNFILPLQYSYEDITANYLSDLVKNLKRAGKHTLHFCESKNFPKAIQLYKNQYSQRFQHVTENDYQHFEGVCAHAMQNGMLTVFEMKDAKEQILSIALLLKDNNRLYNIMNTTTEAGRNKQANHLLMDHIIRLYAKTNIILDFEGSDLSGVKSFYENFGAVNQPYFFIKFNQLPFPFKLFKR